MSDYMLYGTIRAGLRVSLCVSHHEEDGRQKRKVSSLNERDTTPRRAYRQRPRLPRK